MAIARPPAASGWLQFLPVVGLVEGYEPQPHLIAVKPDLLLPGLAAFEADESVAAVLVLIHSLGGDVEAGLALAEAIAGLSKPTASLVMGSAHSIAGVIASAADHSFIAESATMVVHPLTYPVQLRGYSDSLNTVRDMQKRLTRFIATHREIKEKRLEELSRNINEMGEQGTVLSAAQAVREGLVHEIGTVAQAVDYLAKAVEVVYPGRYTEAPSQGGG